VLPYVGTRPWDGQTAGRWGPIKNIYPTVWTTVVFASRHFPFGGELLTENCHVSHPIKYQHFLISSNFCLPINYGTMDICVSLHLWIFSESFIISFCTCSLYNLCFLHSWRWPYIWPKHLAVNCAYKVSPVYLFACVGTNMLRNRIMHGLWITYIRSAV